MTPKATRALVTLLDRASEVVDKEELSSSVWGDQCIEEGTIAQNVYLLRRALGADGRDLIATIPNRGHRFDGEVRKVTARTERFREVAVLPFECLGFAAEGEVPGMAMAETLATELGGRPGGRRAPDRRGAQPSEPASRREFDAALRLGPNSSTAHHWLGFLCFAMGRHDEAQTHTRRALELGPLSLALNTDLGLSPTRRGAATRPWSLSSAPSTSILPSPMPTSARP